MRRVHETHACERLIAIIIYIKSEKLSRINMSFDRKQLISLFNRMSNVKDKLRWGSKKRLEEALNDWQKEDRRLFSQLKEATRSLINIENIEGSA